MVTDPIGDMLGRIRNANTAFKDRVDIPASKVKEAVLKIFKTEGYIANYKKVEDRKQGMLRVYLKYTPDKQRVIQGVRRVSRPGLHVYRKAVEIPQVLRGMGTVVVSTPKGMMGGEQARKEKVGGELICTIW